MLGLNFDPTKAKLITFGALILLFGIFLGMNSSKTPVWVFGWNPELPLIFIMLISFFFGCICGWALFMLFRSRRDYDEL